MAATTWTIIGLLKAFFGDVSLAEMRALSKDERIELADLAAIELGVKRGDLK